MHITGAAILVVAVLLAIFRSSLTVSKRERTASVGQSPLVGEHELQGALKSRDVTQVHGAVLDSATIWSPSTRPGFPLETDKLKYCAA
jgi:hypothetical protein